MRFAHFIVAITTAACLAMPAAAASKFDGKTDASGEVGKHHVVIAIGQDVSAFSQIGAIRAPDTHFRRDVTARGKVGGHSIVAAIGQRAHAYAQVGGIDTGAPLK